MEIFSLINKPPSLMGPTRPSLYLSFACPPEKPDLWLPMEEVQYVRRWHSWSTVRLCI